MGKIMNNVQRHGKAVTIHLKKHHKKYIFGAATAALLYKGISLAIAYIVMHNISFSFADIINNGDEGNTDMIIESITENNNPETIIGFNEEGNNLNEEYETDGTEQLDELQIDEEETDELDETDETEQLDELQIDEEETILDKNGQENYEEDNNGNTENTEENEDEGQEKIEEENTNNEISENIDEEDEQQNNEGGNGICDLGDLIIISPNKDDKIGGNINISREYTNNDCIDDKFIVKLWEQNSQYITLYENTDNLTGFEFDSKQLEFGKYTIREINEEGEEIVVHTGEYEGTGTNYFTGYEISVISSDGNTIYRGDDVTFTIDNKEPELTDINTELLENDNGYANIGNTFNIYFKSDENLKNVKVNVLGKYAILENRSNDSYKFTIDFTTGNTQGEIIYGIEFEDDLGNSGYIEGTSDIILDYETPKIESLEILQTGGQTTVDINLNEKSSILFAYTMTGNKGNMNYLSGTNNTKYKLILNSININEKYEYSLIISDNAKNNKYIKGNFYYSGDTIINNYNEVEKDFIITELGFNLNTNTGENLTGEKSGFDSELLLNNLKKQFEDFNKCKEGIKYNKLELPINNYTATLHMPNFDKTYIKKLVSSFSILLYNEIENKGINQKGIDKITDDFNNFLVILKIVRDDDNECKQNLSSYYTTKFKSTIIRYGLDE